MNSSFWIGRTFGVDVKIHWTFFLLPAFVAFVGYQLPGGIASGLVSVGIVAVLFTCVLLHELGHLVVAQRLGIGVRDITLLPVGGLARLQSFPEKPLDEARIALAGPLVNFGLAFAFFGVAFLLGGRPSDAYGALSEPVSTLQALFYIGLLNAVFAILNTIPAFPLDGGRILRSLLESRLGTVRATDVSSAIGQYFAIVFFLAGVLGGRLLLAFIAVFLIFGASAERQAVRQRETMGGMSVADVMGDKRHTETITPYHNVGQVLDAIIHGYQKDFPVVDDNGRVVGIVTRNEIVSAAHSSDRFLAVRDLMKSEFPAVSPEDDLFKDGQRLLRESGMRALPVVEGGELVGMLTTEDISQASLFRRPLKNHEASTNREFADR